MNLITFIFEVSEEGHSEFIKAVEELKDFWEEEGFRVSLYRDTNRRRRFLQTFLTEKSVDELTNLIQNNAQAKAAFERIKDSKSRVVVSIMKKLV